MPKPTARKSSGGTQAKDAKLNRKAAESGLMIAPGPVFPVESDFRVNALALFQLAKSDSILTDPDVASYAVGYARLVLSWCRENKITIPFGDMPYYTCLDTAITRDVITILQDANTAANELWGGSNGSSGTPLGHEERRQIALGFLFNDTDACAMYFSDGTIKEEKGVKRTVAALVTFRSDEFPMLTDLATANGIGGAAEGSRTNLNHFCYPFMVSLLRSTVDGGKLQSASKYIVGKSQKAIARVLPKTCQEDYNAIWAKFHCKKMVDKLDPRLIPNYCVTASKIDTAIRMAAASYESVRVCSLEELGITANPISAAEVLTNIYATEELEWNDVFKLGQVAKKLINGLGYIPLLSINGGLRTEVGDNMNFVWGCRLKPNGSVEVRIPERRFKIEDRDAKMEEFSGRGKTRQPVDPEDEDEGDWLVSLDPKPQAGTSSGPTLQVPTGRATRDSSRSGSQSRDNSKERGSRSDSKGRESRSQSRVPPKPRSESKEPPKSRSGSKEPPKSRSESQTRREFAKLDDLLKSEAGVPAVPAPKDEKKDKAGKKKKSDK